jgi:hypothetical protein
VDRLLGTEGEDRNGDIDDALTRVLQRYPEHAPYDLINPPARPARRRGRRLCHGSAGLAHPFNRMYQMTADQTLADAARFWVERTLELW